MTQPGNWLRQTSVWRGFSAVSFGESDELIGRRPIEAAALALDFAPFHRVFSVAEFGWFSISVR